MAFQVREEDGRMVLEGGGARADVAPKVGFNCYRWRATFGERPFDLIYADPRFLVGGRPTSSGTPILFPFPNRIRDARFTWEGKEYLLPRNDGPQINAIHGFAFDRRWRVIDRGAGEDEAWVTGEFRISVDAPDTAALWPADGQLRVTYRLRSASLQIDAEVANPDERPLPFGLGYHPYFRVPMVPNTPADECTVQALAGSVWELQQYLPTGARHRPEGARDLSSPRPFRGLTLDDVYGELTGPVSGSGLRLLGVLRQPSMSAELRLRASTDFRELVLFTPGHRQAVCLEPYTCVTDAVNLHARGVDTGWRVLAPGATWRGTVVMEVSVSR